MFSINSVPGCKISIENMLWPKFRVESYRYLYRKLTKHHSLNVTKTFRKGQY